MKMKKALALVLALCMVLGTMSSVVFADVKPEVAEPVESAETENLTLFANETEEGWAALTDTTWYDATNPQTEYTIDSAAELAGLAKLVNEGNSFDKVSFKLTADIDLEQKDWTPIGNKNNQFKGYFDGADHTISNLWVSSTGNYVGLFGYVKGTSMTASATPSVQNLKLENVFVQGYNYVGGLTGQGYTCNISNVSVSGEVNGNRYVGGLVGHVYVYFDNCHFVGDVTGTFDAIGGIAGAGDGRVYNSSVIGDVTGNNWVGGIIANGQEGTSIVGCYVKGTISSGSNWYFGVGGIAGVGGHGHSGSVIKDNYFDGEVYLCGEKVNSIVVGLVNAANNESIGTTVEGNSWNTEYYSAKTPVVVTADSTSDCTPAEWAASASEEKSSVRNNNLVMLESDLAYVNAEDAADVTVMAGSTITPEQVETAVQNRAVATIPYAPYAVAPTGEFGTASYREAMKVDLSNVNATQSLVVELWDGDTKLSATTLRQTDRDDASVSLYPYSGSATCNIVFDGTRLAGSWDTEWFVDLTQSFHMPNKVVVYVNGIETDSWTGTILNPQKYVDNTKVIGAAAIDTQEYTSLQAAFDAASSTDVIELLSDLTVTEEIRVKNSDALKGVTLNGNNHTLYAGELDKETTSILYLGDNGTPKVWCDSVTIKDLTIDAKSARFGIMFFGGNVSVMENVTIKGDYYYGINFYGTGGATMTNCDITTVFTNAQDANPLNLVNTKIGKLYANKSDVVEEKAKVYLDSTSFVDELYFWGESTNMIDSLENIGSVKTAAGEETVAQIGKVQYSTLKAAVDAAQDSATIDLLNKTVPVKDAIKVHKNISIQNGTLDVSGWALGGEGIITVGERDGSFTVNMDKVNVVGTDYASAAGVFRLFNNSVLNMSNAEITLTNDTSESGGVFKGYDGTETFNLTNVKMTLNGTQRIMANAIGTVDNLTVDAENIGNHGFRNFAGTIQNSNIVIDGCETGIKMDAGKTMTVNNSYVEVQNASNDQNDAGIVLLGGRDQLTDTNSTLKATIYQDGVLVPVREINISTDETEVVAGEEVKISVTLDGVDLAGAKWTLTYDPAKFELVGETGNGTINDKVYKMDGSVYGDGETVKTYTFKAIAQTEVAEGDFVISDTYAYTYLESIDAPDVSAINNEKVTVKINLKKYDVAVKVDGNEVTASSMEMPYDDGEHTFEIVTEPAATVTYKVNGEEVNAVSVKDEKVYTIEYRVVPEIGYAEVTGTFILTVAKPDYVVEVNLEAVDGADYVTGKKVVLVYTDTDNVFFNYDGNLMIDVTAREYLYNNETSYKHVFAFVTDAIADGTTEDYKAKVEHLYSGTGLHELTYLDKDLNFNGTEEIRDIITAYGIYNVNADYFANIKYQKNILKADTNGDKCVNGVDTGAVVTAVYPTQTSAN